MKRDATQTIWRTVVFAGAMLGAPACSKTKPAPTVPPSNTASTHGGDAKMTPMQTAKPDTTPNPCAGGDANPCAGDPRPRGTDDDGGGGMGRGFVLS